jgi:hypothetical protein
MSALFKCYHGQPASWHVPGRHSLCHFSVPSPLEACCGASPVFAFSIQPKKCSDLSDPRP